MNSLIDLIQRIWQFKFARLILIVAILILCLILSIFLIDRDMSELPIETIQINIDTSSSILFEKRIIRF